MISIKNIDLFLYEQLVCQASPVSIAHTIASTNESPWLLYREYGTCPPASGACQSIESTPDLKSGVWLVGKDYGVDPFLHGL